MKEAAVLEALYIPGDAVCIAWRSRKREEAKGDNGIYVIVEMNHLSTRLRFNLLFRCDTSKCFEASI